MADRYVEFRAILPAAYVEYIEANEGWEGEVGQGLDYVMLWSKAEIQKYWGDYEMATSLGDRWFAFGSNGGGEMLCFDLNLKNDQVFWLPYIGMADEEPLMQDYTFKDIARVIMEQQAD